MRAATAAAAGLGAAAYYVAVVRQLRRLRLPLPELREAQRNAAWAAARAAARAFAPGEHSAGRVLSAGAPPSKTHAFVGFAR